MELCGRQKENKNDTTSHRLHLLETGVVTGGPATYKIHARKASVNGKINLNIRAAHGASWMFGYSNFAPSRATKPIARVAGGKSVLPSDGICYHKTVMALRHA